MTAPCVVSGDNLKSWPWLTSLNRRFSKIAKCGPYDVSEKRCRQSPYGRNIKWVNLISVNVNAVLLQLFIAFVSLRDALTVTFDLIFYAKIVFSALRTICFSELKNVLDVIFMRNTHIQSVLKDIGCLELSGSPISRATRVLDFTKYKS